MVEMFVQILAQVAALLLFRFRGSKPTGKVPAVQDFELERFLGTWYVAAYIPPPFQKRLNGASAEYTRSDDGTLKVITRTYQEKKNQWQVEESTARLHEDEGSGWFDVDSPHVLETQRKIVYLDKGYTQAIVVGRTMRVLWITYRDPHLEVRDLEALLHKAQELGFKSRMLVRVDQSESALAENDEG